MAFHLRSLVVAVLVDDEQVQTNERKTTEKCLRERKHNFHFNKIINKE